MEHIKQIASMLTEDPDVLNEVDARTTQQKQDIKQAGKAGDVVNVSGGLASALEHLVQGKGARPQTRSFSERANPGLADAIQKGYVQKRTDMPVYLMTPEGKKAYAYAKQGQAAGQDQMPAENEVINIRLQGDGRTALTLAGPDGKKVYTRWDQATFDQLKNRAKAGNPVVIKGSKEGKISIGPDVVRAFLIDLTKRQAKTKGGGQTYPTRQRTPKKQYGQRKPPRGGKPVAPDQAS